MISKPIDKEFNVEISGERFSASFLNDLVDAHTRKIAPRYRKFQRLYEGKHKIQGRKKQIESAQMAGSLSETGRRKGQRILRFLEEGKKKLLLEGVTEGQEAFGLLKNAFEGQAQALKKKTAATGNRLENLFTFVENAFAQGNEMLILVTELTVNNDSARFIGQFGCDAYERHNQELMLSERGNGLMEEILALEL